MESLLETFIASDGLHAKWLNTLSYLENCGAKMIAACEHPTLVKKEMLKHAAEEFRHALHLKRQIDKLDAPPLPTYALPYILGGAATLHYLRALDVQACRYLKAYSLVDGAYLLVTYAIELRAEKLYPLYDDALRKAGSPVRIKSILLEEKEHLQEMRDGIKLIPDGETHAERVSSFEEALYERWIHAVRYN